MGSGGWTLELERDGSSSCNVMKKKREKMISYVYGSDEEYTVYMYLFLPDIQVHPVTLN